MTKETVIDGIKIIHYESENILIFENILDNDICNNIIKIIDTAPLTKATVTLHQNTNSYRTTIPHLLTENDSFFYEFSENNITNEPIYTNSLNGITHKEIKEIENVINNKIKLVNDLLKSIGLKLRIFYHSGYELRKLFDTTRLHTDGVTAVQTHDITFIYKNTEIKNYNMIRNITVIIALNDNYEGGKFKFPAQNISFKLKKGSILLFPPYWTHPHEVSALNNNTFRYTINTWGLENLRIE
jgi:hypothetical protein